MTHLSAPISTTVDPDEIAKFQALAAEWWDINGPMAPLHRMNPCRLEFITAKIKQYFGKIEGLNILDVGCGGGLTAEPLTRLGAKVTGIDGATSLIDIARHHADMENLKIDYKAIQTVDLIAAKKTFDVVLALEVIEHVPDRTQFVSDIAQLTKPRGLSIFSTLNRTAQSFAFGVIASEYLLKWLPRGTHNWKRFIKPSELHELCIQHDLTPDESVGVIYNPMTDSFSLNERNLKINYLLSAVKE